MSTTKAFTVSELTDAVKSALASAFPASVTVSGEISSCSRASSGHYYFTLKDDKASLKCVLFKGYAARNPAYQPKNGDAVKAVGELTVYERGGEYQLVVRSVNYDSVGIFYQKFEATKKALEADGLFDEARKQPVPSFVRRIALVTSPTGAAVTDFTRTANLAGGRFMVELWPVPVQGEPAVGAIVETLVKAGNMSHRYDALVLMRGGGSLDDLAIFNDEAICRAFAASKVPTVSAIGHERDVTIADLVADLRVATPTAAAEHLSRPYGTLGRELTNLARRLMNSLDAATLRKSRRFDELMYRLKAASPAVRLAADAKRIDDAVGRMEKRMLAALVESRRRLDAASHRIAVKSPVHQVAETRQRIIGNENRVRHAVESALSSTRNRLDRAAMGLSAVRPERMLKDADKRVSDAERRLGVHMAGFVRLTSQRVEGLMETMAAYDPDGVLRRGYAIVEKNEKAVGSVRDVHIEDELAIRMKDGYIVSFVTGRKVMEDK